jgi:hypothetical protein
VSSASEAEYAALFLNAQTGTGIRNTLADLGYPQPATPMICDNTTVVGITNRTSKMRKSKAIDMRFHWIRDRSDQGQFDVKWQPAASNLADYFTKTLPVCQHFDKRSTYVGIADDPGWKTVIGKRRSKDNTSSARAHIKNSV